RLAVADRARLDPEAAPAQRCDDRLRRLVRALALERAVAGQEAARLVDRREHRQVVHARELEVLGARARGDVDDPFSLVEGDVVPGNDAVADALLRGQVVERPAVLEPDELLAAHGANRGHVPRQLARAPLSLRAEHVLGVRLDRGRDVRGERPRRRRPDDERLFLPALQGEAHVERRVLELAVVLLARLLVLRERGAAARAPLRRALALVEPAAPVRLGEESPDVLDVRVREGEVVVAPVHPLPEPLRLIGHDPHIPGDPLLAALGELGEAVVLDLALRVEAELLLYLDLDPEALAVEPVLVALVEAAERLVALEDVLQRAAPRMVDAHRVVGRDRPVDEAPARVAAALLAEAVEGALLVPPRQYVVPERRVVRDRRRRR